ncbi:TonB-dependent receptor plug domain-containing protein [Kaarinaea lacus]
MANLIKKITRGITNERHCIQIRVYLLFLYCGFPFSVIAAEPDLALVSESEYFADIPVVESVTNLKQARSEIPAAVSIIDSEMIRASGARSLADLFRLAPGMQVANPRIEVPSVTYHGPADRNSRRMLILIDGRSSYSAFIGKVNWSNLSVALEDIERIEIVRGPNTVTYGANAFLGTINIITRHAAQTHGTTLKAAAGNHDILDGLVRVGTGFSGGDVRLSASYSAEDGLDDIPDDLQTASLNLRADLQPGIDDTIFINLGVAETTAGVGAEDNLLNPPTDREKFSHSQQIRWQHRFSVDNEFSLQFYHNYLENRLEFFTEPLPLPPPYNGIQIPINNDGEEHRYDLEMKHLFKPFDAVRLAWGLGAREDTAQSEASFASNETLKNRSSRLFGNAEWYVTDATVINAGLMIENNDLTGTDASPRLALNYHLSHTDTVRLAWSRARRIPSLFEEFADTELTYQNFLIDKYDDAEGSLDVETMNSYELGYLGHFPTTDLTLDVRLYRDHIVDFITQVRIPAPDFRDGFAQSYRNDGEVTVDGLDIELTYKPSHHSRIILSTAFMHATAENFSANSIYTEDHYEASVPDYSGSLLAMHRFAENWYASAGFYWVNELLWLGEAASRNHKPVDAYTRLDLRLARRMRFTGVNGELALVVQNAGDEYEDFRTGHIFDSRTFVTLQLDF